MNATAPQSLPDAVPRGILAEAERPVAAFYFCNVRPGVAVLGQVLEATLAAGRRALVLARSEAQAHLLSRGLWCYRRAAFVPHGLDGPLAHLQPALITAVPRNGNEADVLVLPDGEPLGDVAIRAGDAAFAWRFRLLLTVLDATDEDSVRSAGRSWNAVRAMGYETVAFEREAPPAARRTTAVRGMSELDSPVPLRWHRIA